MFGFGNRRAETENHRQRGKNPVGEKRRVKIELLGEHPAEPWAERRTGIVRAVQSRQDPAALFLVRQVDAGNFTAQRPDAVTHAHDEAEKQQRRQPR